MHVTPKYTLLLAGLTREAARELDGCGVEVVTHITPKEREREATVIHYNDLLLLTLKRTYAKDLRKSSLKLGVSIGEVFPETTS